MVRVQLREIFAAQPALNNLLKMKMPVKASFRLQKIARKLLAELEDFEKVRLSLVDKFAPETDDDKPKQVPEDRLPEFRKEVDEVLDEEVELDIQPVPLNLFDGVDMEVGDAMALYFIFKE